MMDCTDDGVYEIDNIKVGDRYRYKIKPKKTPVEETDKLKEEKNGRLGNS